MLFKELNYQKFRISVKVQLQSLCHGNGVNAVMRV